MNIIFLGASNFSVPFLKSLYNSKHKISAVITLPDRKKGRGKKKLPTPVKKISRELGLKMFETVDMGKDLINYLKGLEFGYTVVASFGIILPNEFLNIKPGKNINVHPSLLPKYRGPTPMASALLNGEKLTGISIMKITEKMDTGPIYSQLKFRISKKDNKDSLEKKVIRLGCNLLLDTLTLIEEGKLKPFAQDGSKASYTQMINKKDLRIDWSLDAEKINNKIRAFSYKPGCFTFLGKRRIKILEAEVKNKNMAAGEGGLILKASKREGLEVACGNSTSLLIKLVQPSGKKMMAYKDFLNGYPLKAGEKFG